MDLRKKFGLLALIYVGSLSANFAMSALCIVVYFSSAFHDYQSGAYHEQQIELVRKTLRRQRELLDETSNPADLAAEYSELQERFDREIAPVEAELHDEGTQELGVAIRQTADHMGTLARRWLALRLGGHRAEMLPEEINQAFVDLDMNLLRASRLFGQQRQEDVEGARRTQERVVAILVANTAAGAVLCAVGVFFVRRWVIDPIGDLRKATAQISQGNFAYRIETHSSDELGHLANEVNSMSATILQMQTRLIEQGRLAAAGEMVTRLAHNIRNPLAGIRGLAEATIALHADDPEVSGCQQRIIDTVDRFEKWLRDLQQSVSPLELHPHRVEVGDVVRDVLTALQPMLDRRGVKVRVVTDPAMRPVMLDSLHFEQALVALVTNAVQASEFGEEVLISARPHEEGGSRWILSVEDHGIGIPRDILPKIFLPYFTTKPEGNGIGLAIANKVVRLHGGELSVDSEPGRGSRFDAVMPGLVTEA